MLGRKPGARRARIARPRRAGVDGRRRGPRPVQDLRQRPPARPRAQGHQSAHRAWRNRGHRRSVGLRQDDPAALSVWPGGLRGRRDLARRPEPRHLSDGQKADHRARRVGFVFQSYNLLPVLNALENVELPLLLSKHSAAEARRRALRALEVVGLENRLRHRPSELSGGQQQRVAIARACPPSQPSSFADEPARQPRLRFRRRGHAADRSAERREQTAFVLVTPRPRSRRPRRPPRPPMRDGETRSKIVADLPSLQQCVPICSSCLAIPDALLLSRRARIRWR